MDPRDIEWEAERPVYRVYFWHQPPAPPDVGQEQVGWHCDEYRLTGATDVEEALNWARGRAKADQTFVLYAECGDVKGQGLLRLWGVDPNAEA